MQKGGTETESYISAQLPIFKLQGRQGKRGVEGGEKGP